MHALVQVSSHTFYESWKMKNRTMQMSITENKGEGHPEDNLGCPCLSQDIQLVTADKDSRTTYLGSKSFKRERALLEQE